MNPDEMYPRAASRPGWCRRFLGMVTVAVALCLASVVRVDAQAKVDLGNSPGCLFELSGIIDKDAVRQFADVTARYWTPMARGVTEDNADRALCLDSPGGNFLAARDISEIVHRLGIATRVPVGATCTSACSIVFMAGRVLGAEGDGPRRLLDVGGQLGFHAPYLDLEPSAQFRGEVIMNYIEQHNGMIADFIRFGLDRSVFSIQPNLSPALLAELMGTGPNGMYMIDTVEKAARWNISLSGHQEMRILRRDDFVQLCSNYLSWIYDREADTASPAALGAQVGSFRNRLYIKDTSFLTVNFQGLADRACAIEHPDKAVSGVVLCLDDGFSGLSLGKCRDKNFAYGVYVPWWHAMPPLTPIARLAR